MADLLPCPFCGGEDPMPEHNCDGHYWVECGLCEARGPLETAAEEAAESWNRRTAAWKDLMAILDKNWPENVSPPGDDPARDAGARIAGLLRWVGQLRRKPPAT